MVWDAQHVRQLRHSLGLTQSEFALALGCRQQTVSEWELGLYLPANAYARLLTSLQNQRDLSAPILHRTTLPVSPAPIVVNAEWRPEKEVTESDDEHESSDSFSFDKPFDPAID